MIAKDFLSIRDFTPQQIRHLLDAGLPGQGLSQRLSHALKGKTLAMIFEKPSLRTRVTSTWASSNSADFPLYLSPAEINLGKRESVYDVAKNLERMVQGIMIRTFAHEIVEEMAAVRQHSRHQRTHRLQPSLPGDGRLPDDLEVKGRIAGLKVAYIGDGNNVAHSLMFAGAQLGADVWVATPPGYEPEADASDMGTNAAAKPAASCTITNDPELAVRDADVVYTDVWASMGQEAEAEAREEGLPALPGQRQAVWPGQAGRDLPALPARAPWRRSDRRGDRLAAFVCLSAGGESPACAEGNHAGTDEGTRQRRA